ncbi:Dihydrofolate reductase [Mesorhizobium ventifaucium]|uniref:Dihydrofolate reductase n=1 Tax=Mesorhizobium ventifaucium TaxID=666020 RepID=A0ABM9DYU2_9HYPH|nr:Dihydrofolate reductase [Mesorhizobium ventifaucium]
MVRGETEAPMARIVYAMLMSLDGYIAWPDGDIALPVPEGELHRHFNDMVRQTSIALCGRRMYEAMRFWDSPDRETGAEIELDFARAWRGTPKIVFSTTLREVGPNARLANGDVENVVGSLKSEAEGQITVAGRRSCRASRTFRSDRRVPALHPPGCAWRRQAVLPVRPVADLEAAW